MTCFQDVISSKIPDGSDEISHHQHDHSSENRTDWSCVGEPGFQTSKQTMSKVWLVGQSLVFHIFCRDLSFSYKSKLGKCASFAHQTLLRLKLIRGISSTGFDDATSGQYDVNHKLTYERLQWGSVEVRAYKVALNWQVILYWASIFGTQYQHVLKLFITLAYIYHYLIHLGDKSY